MDNRRVVLVEIN